MTKEELKTAVKYCYDNNIVVFDCDAKPREITLRLLKLLFDTFEEYNLSTPTAFFMSEDARFQLTEKISKINTENPSIKELAWFYEKCRRTYNMNEARDYFKNELKGTLAYGDENIILAVDTSEPLTNKSVMMGSY